MFRTILFWCSVISMRFEEGGDPWIVMCVYLLLSFSINFKVIASVVIIPVPLPICRLVMCQHDAVIANLVTLFLSFCCLWQMTISNIHTTAVKGGILSLFSMNSALLRQINGNSYLISWLSCFVIFLRCVFYLGYDARIFCLFFLVDLIQLLFLSCYNAENKEQGP